MIFLNYYIITANGNKFYSGLVSYCGKAWDVHLDCVMKVSSVRSACDQSCDVDCCRSGTFN